MSDFPPSPGPPPGNQPPAPGYWQASDGNWYPPESHPDATPTATGQGASPRTIVYANFGQRLGAFLLDGLIIGVPAAIIFFGVLSAVPTEIVLCDEGLCEQPTGSGFAILFLVGLAMLVFVVWFWWGKLIGETGQTPGRKATGIRVVGRYTGQPIGMGKGIGRGFMGYVSSWLCYLGYLWMLWDDNNQTWHDKVVDSVVVQA